MTTNKELPIDKNIPGHDNQKFSLSNFFEMCWQNKIIIISLVLFCIIMGFVFLINSKNCFLSKDRNQMRLSF